MFLLKSLYANGVISRDDYDQVRVCLDVRNQVVHGFPPDNLSLQTTQRLLDFATRLLKLDPADAETA